MCVVCSYIFYISCGKYMYTQRCCHSREYSNFLFHIQMMVLKCLCHPLIFTTITTHTRHEEERHIKKIELNDSTNERMNEWKRTNERTTEGMIEQMNEQTKIKRVCVFLSISYDVFCSLHFFLIPSVLNYRACVV